MKRWRKPIWAWLTLWALIALQAPSPLWACPMTGRIGEASHICRMPAGRSCCKQHNGSCCKFLPFPLLPQNSDDDRQQNVLAPVAPEKFSGAPVVYFEISFLPAQSAPLYAAPAMPEIFPQAASPPFLTLHRPAPLAPRAPPVSLLS